MRVQNISFKGGYWETSSFIGNADSKVENALNNARPYLKQIGSLLPDPRELVVKITKEDKGDTFIKAYDYNAHNGKEKILAVSNNNTITSNGLNFVTKIFKSLEKNNKREFNKIAGNFVKRLDEVVSQKTMTDFSPKPHTFEWDPTAASC